jgi:hypothetical protein
MADGVAERDAWFRYWRHSSSVSDLVTFCRATSRSNRPVPVPEVHPVPVGELVSEPLPSEPGVSRRDGRRAVSLDPIGGRVVAEGSRVAEAEGTR